MRIFIILIIILAVPVFAANVEIMAINPLGQNMTNVAVKFPNGEIREPTVMGTVTLGKITAAIKKYVKDTGKDNLVAPTPDPLVGTIINILELD